MLHFSHTIFSKVIIFGLQQEDVTGWNVVGFVT